MAGGFERLRIALAVGVAGSSLVPLGPENAYAAGFEPLPYDRTTRETYVSGPFLVFSSATWRLSNNPLAPSFPTSGYALLRGGIHATVFSPTGTFTSDASAAFDSFALVRINGADVYQDPDGTIDLEGNTARTTPTKVKGLRTDVRHDFLGIKPPGYSIVRVLVTMKNTGPAAVRKTVEIGTKLVSGGNTQIDDTESGDTNVGADDAWIQTRGTTGNTAAVLIARGDAGNGAVTEDPDVNGNAVDRYVFRVGAKKTIRLLYYAVIGHNPGVINLVESDFDNGQDLFDNDLLAGLTAQERAQVRNWSNLPTAPAPP